MRVFRKLLIFIIILCMVLSVDFDTMADITTGLVGQYDFDDDINNSVNEISAKVTAGDVTKDGSGRDVIFIEGVTGGAILFNGKESDYGLELINCTVKGNTFTISYDVYYTAYTQFAPSVFMSVYFFEGLEKDEEYIQFGQIDNFSLAYAPSVLIHSYHYDALQGTNTRDIRIVPEKPVEGIVSDTSEYAWDAEWLKWTNITYVFDNDNVIVYVDGEQILVKGMEESGDVYEGNDDVKIFLGACQKEEPVSAAFDNLYIFDRALSKEDIQELISKRDYSKELVLPKGIIPTQKNYDAQWGIDNEDVETDNTKVSINNNENVTNDFESDTTESVKKLSEETTIDIVKKITTITVLVTVIALCVNALFFGKRKRTSFEDDDKTANKFLNKVFSVRSFLIIVSVVFVVGILCIKINQDKRQQAQVDRIENSLQYKKDNNEKSENNGNTDANPRYNSTRIKDKLTLDMAPEAYCDMESDVDVSKALKYGGINVESVKGIMIGADIDGEGIERYYFTDKEVIEKVINKLKDMKLTRVVNTNMGGYEIEKDWDIQLCSAESEYALRISGEPTDDDRCYRTCVQEVFNVGYFADKDSQTFVNPYKNIMGGEFQFLFDSDIEDFLAEIIESNVEEMNKDTVINLCATKKVDLGTVFGYKHTPPIYVSSTTEPGCRALEFKFPIKDTEYYILLQKQTFVYNFKPAYAIEKLELYRNEQEYIDLLISNKEEVQEFINK